MDFSISKLSNTQKVFGVILLLAAIAGIVWFFSSSSWNKRLQNELDAIDKEMGSGRVTATQLVDLHQRRNAIVQQIKTA